MRNILAILSVSLLGTAWAASQGPLLGPGNVGEKDEKGGVKGADAGAGPHKRFNQMQLERRVEPEKKQKPEKARPEKPGSEPKR